jgi:hypothetical protein
MRPTAGMDVVAKKKVLPCREPNPGRPARSLFTTLTELSWLIPKKTMKSKSCSSTGHVTQLFLFILTHIKARTDTFTPITFLC